MTTANTFFRAAYRLANVTGVAVLLAACNSDSDTNLSCKEKFSGMTIPASVIGLPTSGAVVTEAVMVKATNAAGQTEYCRVSGDIRPVDPAAPMIKFQVGMPNIWNSKAMMFGGGGFNGKIPSPESNVHAAPLGSATPLDRGYATFGSDSGHQNSSNMNAEFALNDEALQNFSGDALKKTRDVAMYLIKARYGANGVAKSYFAGGSTGGREALAVVQRWPQDWDGAIILFPAWNYTTSIMHSARGTRALALPGAYPNRAKRKSLYEAALAVCDELDGVKDGLISNVAACNMTFDPATATVNNVPLRCAGGADTGDNCLSDVQISALKLLETTTDFGRSLGSGEFEAPGYNVWGIDFGLPGTSGLQTIINALGLNNAQPKNPMSDDAPSFSIFWDQWVRFAVTRDPNFESLTFDPLNPGKWQERLDEISVLMDKNKTDLSALAARGGKILLLHGTADALIATRGTAYYYQRVQTTMGVSATRDFIRYYEIPGYNHGISAVFLPEWDSLTALENWVQAGIAPAAQVVRDAVGVPNRTRPLCEYPAWAKYNGSGDINSASSFTCVTQ